MESSVLADITRKNIRIFLTFRLLLIHILLVKLTPIVVGHPLKSATCIANNSVKHGLLFSIEWWYSNYRRV